MLVPVANNQEKRQAMTEIDEILTLLIRTKITPEDFKQEINRLIVEAELRGFDKAFDSHDYDGLREYRKELSNNLSKGEI